MKKIVVIATALLVLAGAGAGGWFFLFNKNATAAEIEAPPPAAPPVYVRFDPLQLPIMGEDRIEQLINIGLALEVADQQSADRVIALAPKLNDAYIQALYGALNTSEALENGALDVALIKNRLVEVTARIVGEGVVKDALIQMVTQRRL